MRFTSPRRCAERGRCAESGVQFYSNNFSQPARTARKKIHGGSGAQGDGYEPGCTSFVCPLSLFAHSVLHDQCHSPPSSAPYITGPRATFAYVSVYAPPAAAFLELHEPLAAWLHPGTVGASGNDTLLASGEVYNNYVRMDVLYRSTEAA